MPGHAGEVLHGGHSSQTRGGPDKKSLSELEGLGVHEMGHKILQWLLEVVPVRGQSKGGGNGLSLFPLPTSSLSLGRASPSLSALDLSWLVSTCVSLNSLWGCEVFFDGDVSPPAQGCLEILLASGGLLASLKTLTGKHFLAAEVLTIEEKK